MIPAEVKESLEIVNLRGKIRVSTGGFVQHILDLKKWMKSPWIEDKKLINKHEHPFLC